MAKIALAIGGAIAGAVVGMLFPPAGVATWEAIAGGALAGEAAGGIAGQLLFPPHFTQQGPRLNDLTVSTSTNGVSVPFGYGKYRFGGNIIWSPGIKEHSTTTTTSTKGGSSTTSTSYSYTSSFAVAFGEGTGTIERMWGDSKLIYDANPITSGEVVDRGAWDSTVTYNRADKATFAGTAYVAVVQNQNQQPDTSSSWMLFSEVGNPSKYPAPTLYTGSQTQNADPLIQADKGAANVPAFRHLIYAVFEDFPLADFGNRIPNLRAEIRYDITTLSGAVADICDRAGLPSVDTSEI